MKIGSLLLKIWDIPMRYVPKGRPLHSIVQDFSADVAALSKASADYTLPDFTNARWVSLDRAHRSLGIMIKPGDRGRGNWLVLCEGAKRSPHLSIKSDSKLQNNIIVIGPAVRLQGSLHLQGSSGRIYIGGKVGWLCDMDVRLSSNANTLLVGTGTTSNGVRIILEGAGRSAIIGDDCMFARNTHLSTSDLHGISDAETGRWVNPPQDVRLGRHVWVGQDAMIMKGVTVGSGAVVGARSFVNKDVGADTIVGGYPAKTIMRNIVWTRDRSPTPEPKIRARP